MGKTEKVTNNLTNNLTEKVNIMSNENTLESQATESNLNHALSKEDFVKAILDFKAFGADKENGPYKDTYGTKYKGDLRFTTYIFYAMLRNRDINKVTHSVESKRFQDRVNCLKYFAGIGSHNGPWEAKNEIPLVSKCFSSLSEEQIVSIIKSYFA
jgi:hypothetical protein